MTMLKIVSIMNLIMTNMNIKNMRTIMGIIIVILHVKIKVNSFFLIFLIFIENKIA